MVSGISTLLRPRSIAVVGASDRVGSRGAELLANLRSIGFGGTVYPINPGRSSVAGMTAYPDLSAVAAPIDVVAIGVGQEQTLRTVPEAISCGARTVLVLGTGYAEAGPEGVRAQTTISDRCREARVSLVGPNCLGPWSRLDRISYWLAPGSDLPLSGIGLVTQSGALASALMEPLAYRGIALDAVATTGNEAGLGIADFVEHFAEDPRIRVIGLICESVRRPDHLLQALAIARRQSKPVVCLLLGASEAGRHAALAHTAALVGDGDVARAYVGDAGALLVDDLAAFTEHLVLFARYPRGIQDGLAVLTVSGGGSGLIADLAERSSLRLAALHASTRQGIGSLIGGRPVENPVDVALAGDRPGVYLASVELAAADPAVGTVAVGLNLPHAADPDGSAFYAAQVADAAAALAMGKDAVAFALVPGELDAAMQQTVELVDVPVLLGAGPALEALAHAMAYRSTAQTSEPVLSSETAAGKLPSGGPATWDEWALRRSLASYGLPIPVEDLAVSADEACAAASRIGYPVAMKVVAVGLAHKSEVGGVRLGIGAEGEARRAFEELERLVAKLPHDTLRGIGVQRMVASGTELILGSRTDAVFGRAVVLGWGGLWTEAFPQPQVGVVPLSARRAEAMIDALFGGALERARQLLDLRGLQDAMLAFARFLVDLPSGVDVLEINPLIVSETGAVAVDAAIGLAS